jgi:DNA invertase Pin-like site-specific DNA recombinase
MKTSQSNIENIGNIAEIPLGEVVREWRRQRYKLFMSLKQGGKTYEEIARAYNISRQAVGQFLKGAGKR